MDDQHEVLVRRLLSAMPRERTHLLPALLAVQSELRYLPLWAIEQVGLYLRVPKSEAYGVATHFPLLRLEEPGRVVVRVCTGVGCAVNGGAALLAGLEAAFDLEVG